jgi:diguanylate cyclase (GGDEF)-like protein/PAS domain S-box-containing protein
VSPCLPPPSADPAHDAPAPRQTVLVIDDDAIIRLMVSEALGEAGYEVFEARSAEDGWAQFDRRGADLVLLDVILPGINGFEACAQLRAHAAGSNVPIIMMTGLDDRQSIVDAFEAGATDFITKPIVWDLLPYRVRYALRANAALQETVRGRALLGRSQTLANMGSWEWSSASDSVLWSDEMYRIHGVTPGAMGAMGAAGDCGAALLALIHPEDRAQVGLALTFAQRSGQAYGMEFRIVRPDGSVRQLFEQTDVERDGHGAVLAVHGIRRDITQQTEANARIRNLAFFDPLTGLANRALFRDMVQQWLPHAERHAMRCAVLVVDLDRFKLINETLGPRIGDAVLKAVSERLRDGLRGSDLKGWGREQPGEDRLARLGGNEFTALLVDIGDPLQASLVAQRITDALAAPLTVAGHELRVSASIGISMTPDDGQDMDSLLSNAATAMRAAKQDPQPRIRFYDGAMSEQISRRLKIETELRSAIDHGELRVFYQAKVDLRGLRVVGAEALLRWQHPSRGLTGPVEIIAIAEESGLIVSITQWVILQVCRQVAAWRAQGVSSVPVSINLDATSLQTAGLVECIAAALAETGLDASAIEFEVTETGLMQDLARASRTLQALRDLGLKLSIDDFGTGYSSLAYLKRLPVDGLKIDRSFVQDLATDASDAALTTAIIAMGLSLNLELIAEGVETWEQADFLAQRGCFLIQGYLFSKPVASADFAALLSLGLAPRPALVRPPQRALN